MRTWRQESSDIPKLQEDPGTDQVMEREAGF